VSAGRRRRAALRRRGVVAVLALGAALAGAIAGGKANNPGPPERTDQEEAPEKRSTAVAGISNGAGLAARLGTSLRNNYGGGLGVPKVSWYDTVEDIETNGRAVTVVTDDDSDLTARSICVAINASGEKLSGVRVVGTPGDRILKKC
jgi:thioredoxin reductase